MNSPTPNVFLCNGASKPKGISAKAKVVELDYSEDNPGHLVNLKLPKFVDQVYHLPSQLLDLLEIAAYVFAGDRWASRGATEAVEFHAWPRTMHFAIRVREADFWNGANVKEKLTKALVYMTGDHEYIFDFLPGHSTSTTSLFDSEEFTITQRGPASVVLFSGGLDSLAGVLERLHSTNETICLISHRSGQPSTGSTQKMLARELSKKFPGRIQPFSFDCGLHHRAHEETQRSRAFLFGSIAFVLANQLSLSSFYAYENGVTSLNLLRRQDLINARASRTTHPKTQALMSEFLSEIQGSAVKVLNPFTMSTKTDIFELLRELGGQDFIGTAVSCSKIFKRLVSSTHCGGCFQCIDRRLAAYAAGMNELDDVGIYSQNILIDPIDSGEIRTTALDYIRQAIHFAESTSDGFYIDHLSELADIVDFIDTRDEADAVEKIWQLCSKHGRQVIHAIREIRHQLDDPCVRVKIGSLLQLVADREYLKDDPQRLAEQIAEILTVSIPVAFKATRPRDENDLNNQIDALIRAKGDNFRREFPTTQFALAKVIPDHEARQADLIIEAKYIRKATSPSKASDGIAADLTKYPAAKFILFAVYDPDRAIADDRTFKQEIENKRESLVTVIR